MDTGNPTDLKSDVELIKLSDAAGAIKCTPRTIQRYIKRRLIKASWIGNGWRIKINELRRFIDERESNRPIRRRK